MSGDIGFDQFDRLFQQFVDSPTSSSVFRWEGLQAYAHDQEDPSLLAWRSGGPRPERSVRTDPWLARIAVSTVAAGKRWRRVRYVVEPWSDYTAWEMVSYGESLAGGEEILVTTVPLARPHTDFWLFDGSASTDRYAVVMHYDQDGSAERFQYVDDARTLASLHALASEAASAAVPLPVYLSRHAVAGAD